MFVVHPVSRSAAARAVLLGAALALVGGTARAQQGDEQPPDAEPISAPAPDQPAAAAAPAAEPSSGAAPGEQAGKEAPKATPSLDITSFAQLAALFDLQRVSVEPAVGTHQTPPVLAQAPAPSETPTEQAPEEEYYGKYTPGGGFTVANTKYGTLNLTGYSIVRYLNQLPNSGTFKDHLGRIREIDGRNDIQYHRALLHMRGWLFNPRFTYQNSIWGLQSSGQMSMVGSLSYKFSNSFSLSGGIFALPGIFTLMGNFPYWLGSDRVMGSEFFRPGFTGGLWADGFLSDKLFYRTMVGNTISQLGVNSIRLTRDFAYTGMLQWMPTTGEYGPKYSLGDYEEHPKAATRLNIGYTHSREDRFSQIAPNQGPDNTQTRLSDSVLFFETGALAPNVTVQRANYDLLAVSGGVKYRGFSLDIEGYHRMLSKINADGPIPIHTIHDTGLTLQTAKMVTPRTVMAYGFGSYVFGEFNDSWELGAGVNYYPFKQRNMRINLQGLYVDKSPAQSQFGYYVGGMTGPIVSLATDLTF
jgi:hypothetical protein